MHANYRLTLVIAASLYPATPAFAQSDLPGKEAIDVIWLAMASALVFFMQAGFALLESGMSRSKNCINVVMKNYTDVCVGSLFFWLVGFGLMFGANPSGWFGTSGFALHHGKSWDYSFLLFQTMFAATAATIASGAMAERTRFPAYLFAAAVITAFIYPVFGSWAWGSYFSGNGWLAELGFVDFAGSTVVHSVGGWCALAGVMVLGSRLGRFDPRGRARTIPGHNLNFVALGGFVLWFGWFGFNGGSTVGANVNIGLINLNTQLAASAGTGATLLVCLLNRTPITVPAVVNGSLAGLVGITAGCATMEPLWAVITGATASVVAHLGERMLLHFRLDDVVGAVAVHAFAGAWGTAELLPDPTAALSAYKTRRRTSAYASYTLAEVEAFSVLVDKWLSLTQSAAAIDIGNFVRRNLGRLNINTDLKLQVEHWLEDEKQRIKVPRVDIQDLRKIINLFYIGFCEYVGPTRADTLLAEAVTRLKSNGGAAFSEVFNKLL